MNNKWFIFGKQMKGPGENIKRANILNKPIIHQGLEIDPLKRFLFQTKLH